MRPARYFVRIWTPDPSEQEPDAEEDIDMQGCDHVKDIARQLRAKGELAGAFERRNIRVPEECPIPDPPAHLWDYESVRIDDDE